MEIQREQESSAFALKSKPFRRVVKDVIAQIVEKGSGIRLEPQAMEALQTGAEASAVSCP